MEIPEQISQNDASGDATPNPAPAGGAAALADTETGDQPAPGTMAWKMREAGIGGRPIVPGATASGNGSKPDAVSGIMQSAGEAAKQNPNPNAPGAWARNLLAGAVSSLGDAAAATKDLKPGQGALSGVLKTLEARSQRMGQQKQQQFENRLKMSQDQRENLNSSATRAETAARTIAVQKQTAHWDLENDRAAEDLRKFHIDNGKAATDAYRKNHAVQDGVTEGDLHGMVKSYGQSPQKGPDGNPIGFQDVYSVFQTGERQVSGPDGKMRNEPTYSLVTKSGNPVAVDQNAHDFLEKYLPKGEVPPVGTALNGDLFDSQMTRAQNVANGIQAIEKFQGAETEIKQKRDLAGAMEIAGHFAAENVADPFAGLQRGLDQATAHEAKAKKQLELAQQAKDPASIQQAQDYLAQVQKEKNAIETVVNAPAFQAARDKHADIMERGREKLAEKKAQQGELNGARIAEGLDFPSDLSKRSSTLEALKDNADKYSMAKFGRPVNWGKLETDYKYASAKGTQDVMSMVGAVGESGGSLDIAMNAAKGLPNVTDSNTLNKIFSKGGGEFGNQAVSDFHTALYGFADEYAKIMGGGNATLQGFEHAMNLLRDGYTKGQMDSAANILKKDMKARERGLIGNNIFMIRKWADKGEERAQAALRGQDPWAAEKAAGAYNPDGKISLTNVVGQPQVNDTKTYNGGTYKFDGKQWNLQKPGQAQ